MELLVIFGAFFLTNILAGIISSLIYKAPKKVLVITYKRLSCITICLLVIIAILCTSQFIDNAIIGLLAFAMFVIFFTSLNIEHYLDIS